MRFSSFARWASQDTDCSRPLSRWPWPYRVPFIYCTVDFMSTLRAAECQTPQMHLNCSCVCIVDYTRIGSNKGKTPEHNQAKHTKHPHSLEWHNSAITIILAAACVHERLCALGICPVTSLSGAKRRMYGIIMGACYTNAGTVQ